MMINKYSIQFRQGFALLAIVTVIVRSITVYHLLPPSSQCFTGISLPASVSIMTKNS